MHEKCSCGVRREKWERPHFKNREVRKKTIWVPGVLSNRSAFFWWIQWAMNRNLCNTWEDLHTFWQVDWGILSAKRWLHLEDHQHSAFSLSQLITSICTSRMLDWSCHTLLYLLISSTSNLLTRLVILKWSTKLNNSWTKIIKWKVKINQTNKDFWFLQYQNLIKKKPILFYRNYLKTYEIQLKKQFQIFANNINRLL